MSRIDLSKKYDLTHIDWNMGISGSSNGILTKTIIDTKNGRLFLKLGSFSKPFGFYGTEPIIELINSRIGEILSLPVLKYDLKYASVKIENSLYNTFVSVSKDYRINGMQGVSFEKFYKYHKQKYDTTIDFAKRLGFVEYIYKQFIFDFIVCNLDRHGKNTEILISSNKIKIAPFFDNSLTFITNRPENEIKSKVFFNDMMRVNNYIGDLNLLENLLKIDTIIKVKEPVKEDRQFLFQGLGKVTTQDYRDFVWETLNRRVENVKSKKIPFIQWY